MRALLAAAADRLRDARARIEALERASGEGIAVIGAGCRFPGGISSPETFWEQLCGGVDLVSEAPPERWGLGELYDPDPDAVGRIYSRHGAFLDDVDQFDPAFFRISPREASRMDPQHRLLLE